MLPVAVMGLKEKDFTMAIVANLYEGVAQSVLRGKTHSVARLCSSQANSLGVPREALEPFGDLIDQFIRLKFLELKAPTKP